MYNKIESPSNEFYRHLKKLQTRREREKSCQYLAEGSRAVYDAIKNNADIASIVICEGYIPEADLSGFKVYELSGKLFEDAKLTVNSQGILAVINYNLKESTQIDFDKENTILYLDSVTDPGNMGTILRSADAFGVEAIVLSPGCVDVFNPKVVRSSMASLLNVPIYLDKNSDLFFEKLKSSGFDIVGTFPRAVKLSSQHKYNSKTVLIMGNEANGISEKIESYCTTEVKIPMPGNTESLNVATACAVMLYEIMLEKMQRGECNG